MQYVFLEQSLIDSLPIGAAIFTGPQHTIKAANHEMLAIWAKNSSVIGQDLHDAIPEIQDQPFFDLITGIYTTGEPFHNPDGMAMLMVDGEMQAVYFDYWLKPIKDALGKVVGVLNTAINTNAKIKEQRRAEHAIEELQAVNEELQSTVNELAVSNSALETSNEQLNAAKEAAQIGLFDWDLVNQKYAWDTRSKQMFGFAPEDDPSHYNNLFDRLHPDDRKRVNQAVQDARNRELTGGRYDIEYRIIGAGDVPVRWVRALGRMLFNDEGTPVRFIGTLMDITEQVISRQQIQASEEQLRLAVESANLGTWFMNAETNEFVPSPRLKEMFGFNPDEEMPYDAALNQIVEEHRERVIAAVNESIKSGERYDLEYPIVGFRDNKLRWVRATGRLYWDKHNDKSNFSGTVTDITEQKQNEQRKNDFISMVSHELKTPLTSTMSYVQLSQKKALANDDTLVASMLERANKQLSKMTTLINGFLNVSRYEAGKISIDRKRFDMAVLVKEVEESVVPEATSHKVVFAPVEETWVNVDRDKIEQVINNFISNAIKYSPPYTTIQVACVTHGNYAHVSVTDEGMGIKPEDQARLFDRFYRVEGQETKSIIGFGIGLYICKEIIARHDGKIGVNSVPKQGSTFWFTLPVCING